MRSKYLAPVWVYYPWMAVTNSEIFIRKDSRGYNLGLPQSSPQDLDNTVSKKGRCGANEFRTWNIAVPCRPCILTPSRTSWHRYSSSIICAPLLQTILTCGKTTRCN